jgi:predicted lipoprotein
VLDSSYARRLTGTVICNAHLEQLLRIADDVDDVDDAKADVQVQVGPILTSLT